MALAIVTPEIKVQINETIQQDLQVVYIIERTRVHLKVRNLENALLRFARQN